MRLFKALSYARHSLRGSREGVQWPLVIFGALIAACSIESNSKEAESNEAPTATTAQAVWGGILDPNTLTANTVVRLGAGGCGGTLITPNVVVTAAHCLDKGPDGRRPRPTIYVGPDSNSFRTSRTSSADSITYQDVSPPDPEPLEIAAKDVGLVFLGRRVLEEATIVRPVATTPSLAANQAMGVASWSQLDGTGATNADYARYRTSASLLGSAVEHLDQNPGEATWRWSSTTMGTQRGDSGGAFYLGAANQQRNLIGVVTSGDVSAGSYSFADITASGISSWLNTVLLDKNVVGWHTSVPGWYSRHGKSDATMWYGEVEYTGPCRAGDSDCDHWLDGHDDCPNDYNPDQEEDASGKGLACLHRSSLPFDPSHPQPVYKETIAGTCTAESPDCPIGACYLTDVTGQFWEHQGAQYTQSGWYGSYARIDTVVHAPRYTLVHRINPEVPITHFVDEWFMPSDANMKCVAFRDIPAIPHPEQCTLAKSSIRGAAPGQQSSVPLPSNTFNLMSGFIGNIGFPTSPSPFVHVSNGTTSANTLSQGRGTDQHTSFTGEAFSFGCPGFTPTVYTANAQAPGPTAKTTLLASSQRANSFCFLTGLGGAWALGKEGRLVRQPRARIQEDPNDGSLALYVDPGTLPNGSKVAASAEAACVGW